MAFFRRSESATKTAVAPPVGSPRIPVRSKPAKGAATKSEAATGRAAPEPLSILLPAVAALGAVASVAAVAWLAEDRDPNRPKVKRRAEAILRDLETSCLGLAEILRRVIRQSPMFGLVGTSSSQPLKFGVIGARADAAQSHLYALLANDVATMLVLATQASFDLVCIIEDGELSPSDDLLNKFAGAQETLNNLLAKRASLNVLAGTALDVAVELAALVRTLRN